jgi:hypothetical protein
MVTGFTATPGVWNVNLSQSGVSVVFDSSAAVSPQQENGLGVSDKSSTLILMGGCFLGLAVATRKPNRTSLRC